MLKIKKIAASIRNTAYQTLFPILFLSLFFQSCAGDPYQTKTYFSDSERDTLLTNIITYTSQYARGANNATRFQPQFRTEYASRLPQYKLEGLFRAPDSTYYFYFIRPVGSGYFHRAVGGKFRLRGESLMPTQYEEVWCSPHSKEKEVIKERSHFLFRELAKTGNIDKYLPMRHYVEWPDSMLVYDKKINEWVATGKY